MLISASRNAALNPGMRFRVSDAYCNRWIGYPKRGSNDLAIADLEPGRSKCALPDGCLRMRALQSVGRTIYLTETQEYDKAREVVALAQRSGKWIEPEYLAQLKASSAAR